MHAIEFDVEKLIGKTITDFTVTTNKTETEITVKFDDGSAIGILGGRVTHTDVRKDELYIRDL